MEKIKINKLDEFGSVFDFEFNDKIYNDIEISLLGEYQVYNATLAMYTLLILKEKGHISITDEEIRNGLKKNKMERQIGDNK